MNEIPLESYIEAIRATHGCESLLRDKATVREEFEGETVWEGEVLIFDLIDHPTATRCYAWEVDGEVTAVLRVGGIDIVVTSARHQVYDPQYFKHAGIDPAAKAVLAVKSAHHFRAAFEPMAHKVIVVDDGGHR